MTQPAAETETMDLGMDTAAPEEAKRPTFIARVIKKLLSWTVTLVLCVGFYMFISNLQGDQKEAFFDDARQQAVLACGTDGACMGKVRTHFDDCIRGNYSSYKKGKYSRKYVFDLEGFQGCVQSKP